MRHTVDPRGDHRSVQAGRQIALLDRLGDGGVGREQESSPHRNAGRAVGQCRREPTPVEESAGGDHRHVGAL